MLTIAPGLFDSVMLHGVPEKAQASFVAQVPTHPTRLGRPEEYVAHVVHNSILNGETIRLDDAVRMAPR